MATNKKSVEVTTLRPRSLLTIEYIFALGSIVGATLLVCGLIIGLFTLWVNGSSAASVTGLIAQLSPQLSANASATLVTTAVFAVLLSVIGIVLFRRVSIAISHRPGYTKRLAYQVPTYTAFSVLLIAVVLLTGKLIGILINSLLFIGVDNAGDVYKAFYLQEFVPYLIGLALIATVTFYVYRIINGVNVSRTLSWLVLGKSVGVLLAAAITIGVIVHDDGSSTKRTRSIDFPSVDRSFERSFDRSEF